MRYIFITTLVFATILVVVAVALLFVSIARAETLDDQLVEFRKLNTMPSAPTVPTPQVWPRPTTYAEARSQAIARGLPLIIWSGNGL